MKEVIPNYSKFIDEGDKMFMRYEYGEYGLDDIFSFMRKESYTSEFIDGWWLRIKDKISSV